jgi:hypothetical protein
MRLFHVLSNLAWTSIPVNAFLSFFITSTCIPMYVDMLLFIQQFLFADMLFISNALLVNIVPHNMGIIQ